jgi:hypothetical protein
MSKSAHQFDDIPSSGTFRQIIQSLVFSKVPASMMKLEEWLEASG